MRNSSRIAVLLIGLPLWAQSQSNLRLNELRPNQGLVGTSVSLTAIGSGFFNSAVGSAANIPGSALIWRRNQVETRLPTTFISSTTPNTVIPASLMINAPGTAEILVENGNANFCDGPCPRSGALTFTITLPTLQLTSLNPNRAPTRAATGAPQDFLLSGQGFAPNAQVFWQAAAGTSFTELEVLTRTGSGAIQAQIPAALLTQPGAPNVLVRNPGSQQVPAAVSNTLPFTVFQALRLDRLDPAALPAGSPNTKVTAFGQGFSDSTRLGFRDAGGTRTPSNQVVSVQQGTIEVIVGADLLTASKTWQVVAFDGNFQSDPLPFQVTAGVTISSLSPNTRAAGSGQFELTVNGAGFTADAEVLFGNTTLTPTNRTPTQLRVNATALAAPGPVNVSVRVGSGANAVTSNGLTFTFTALAPVISALSPPSRPVNSGDFDLTITGQNFTPNPTVTIGGQSVTIIGTPTATSIAVRVPNARIQQAGNAAVVVRVNEVDSAGFNLQVTAAAPTISSLSPASRPAGSGDFDLTISGQNFLPSPAVTLGGQAVTISGAPTATSITVRIPGALIQRVGDVAVMVRVNNVNSDAVNFQVTAGGPSISTLNPASRPAGSGDFTLTINGQGLTPTPTVTFGGQAVSLTGTPAAGSIQVLIPNARIQQAGPVDVRLQVGDQTVNATFTVTAPQIPAVTVSSGAADVPPNGNSSTSVALAGPAPVTVTGTLELSFVPNAAGLPAGYADPAMVFVSGSQRRLAFTINQNQMAATIPGGGAFNVGTVAGTITVRVVDMNAAGVNITSLPQPRTVTIPRGGPSLTPGSARLVNSAGGVTVEVQGFSPTREITQAVINFTIASGVTAGGSTSFTVPLQPVFTTWFASEAGRNNGSRFLLQIPFTVAEGDANQITGFSIALASPEGSPATLNGTR